MLASHPAHSYFLQETQEERGVITQRQHTTRHQKLSHRSAGQVCSEKHCLARDHPGGTILGLTPQPFTFLVCSPEMPHGAPHQSPVPPRGVTALPVSSPGTDTPNTSERGSTATSQHPLHTEPTGHLQHQETFHFPATTVCCMTCSGLQWQTRIFGPFQVGGFGARGAQPLTAPVLAQEGRQWPPKRGGNI